MDDPSPPAASARVPDPSGSDTRQPPSGPHVDLLGPDVLDAIAEAIHGRYVAAAWAQHAPADGDLALRPWAELPETLRRSNLDQAAAIVDKLHRLGCDVVPAAVAGEAQGEEAPRFAFTDTELDLLAEAEHERWVRERRAQGWVADEERDVARRTTPDLVPWSELSDDVRELDRDAVRGIPEVLAGVGLRIVRRR